MSQDQKLQKVHKPLCQIDIHLECSAKQPVSDGLVLSEHSSSQVFSAFCFGHGCKLVCVVEDGNLAATAVQASTKYAYTDMDWAKRVAGLTRLHASNGPLLTRVLLHL